MTFADRKLDIFRPLGLYESMARGSRQLDSGTAQRLVSLWAEDTRFGTRYSFASRLAEIVTGSDAPTKAAIKAADKRLERLEKRQAKLTNLTASAIAEAKGIRREQFDLMVFRKSTLTPAGAFEMETPPSLAEEVSTYRHFEIIYDYVIMDVAGRKTSISTAERVEVLQSEVRVGGSYWESRPQELSTYYKYAKEGESPWPNAIPVKNRIEKTGKIYRWDTFHEPALVRNDAVWFLSRFHLKNEFTSTTCRDSFHSMQPIGSFTWRVKFPPRRPAKRWWVTVEYHPSLPSNAILASHKTTTGLIIWSMSDLPKGVIYFMNWEW